MKRKVIILALSAILTISGASLAYGLSRNNDSVNNFNGQMMSTQSSDIKSAYNHKTTMMGTSENVDQSNDNFDKMIEIMKENGFTDEAKAMENGDFNEMKNFMTNISNDDYNKMINIMKDNGYESMADEMGSIDKENMVNIHKSMMGN